MPVKQDTEEKKTKLTLQDRQPKRTPPQGTAGRPCCTAKFRDTRAPCL